MGIISMPKHLIWQSLQYEHILSLIMHFHTGNMYFSVVLTVHVSTLLTKKQIKTLRKTPSIRFHIYQIITRCTYHVRIPLKDKKICYMCKQESSSDEFRKIYTRKELVMMETKFSDFHTSFYVPDIKNPAFHLPHVRIIGTNHCCEMQSTLFKRRESFQDVICCRDYSVRVVASFDNQIKSEYYGGNISVSIEYISLKHFIAVPKTDINPTTPSRHCHAVFHYFYHII